jgi:hypothetical protein
MPLHTITLIYDAADETVISQRDAGPIQIGDTVIFQSDAGPVHIKLDPADVLSAPGYHTGMAPLEVKKLSKLQYWCGVEVGGKHIGWPQNEKFGNQDDFGGTDGQP